MAIKIASFVTVGALLVSACADSMPEEETAEEVRSELGLGGVRVPLASGCNVDADCTKVDKTCCKTHGRTAVLASRAADYEASLRCPSRPYCRLRAPEPDDSMPQCNLETKRCELVAPDEIACGGFTLNPHECPDGYQCLYPEPTFDVPGRCVRL